MPDPLILVTATELRAIVREAVQDALGTATEAPPRYAEASDIAKHFGVSRATVSAWKQDGCPHILRGKVLRFELAAVEAWFRGREPGLRRVK